MGNESLTLPMQPSHMSSASNEAFTQRLSHASTSDAAVFVASNPSTVSRRLDSNNGSDVIGTGETRWPAAICSTLAGTACNLKRIAANIEDDREGNETTFIVLRNARRAD